VAELGDGQVKAAPEYQDCKRIADQTGRPIRDVMEDAAFAFRQTQGKGKKAKVKGKGKK
jgi:pyridinium-3,5-bisthiocarboxylic acid mononucleotide nickel chelatase